MSAMLAERPATMPLMPGACPVIETARLVLRPHRMQDADAIANSLGDFAVAQYCTTGEIRCRFTDEYAHFAISNILGISDNSAIPRLRIRGL